MNFQDVVEDELLDLVDKNDQVIQVLPRSLVYKNKLNAQMRAVWLMIKNDKGELWIARRSMKVKQLPGHLDGAAVGHVRSGETYEQAMIRETAEEVGLDMTKIKYRFLGKITPHEHQAFCFAAVYECVLNQAPEYWNREEIAEWFWLTPQEIIKRVEQGEKVKDSLPIILKKFYGI